MSDDADGGDDNTNGNNTTEENDTAGTGNKVSTCRNSRSQIQPFRFFLVLPVRVRVRVTDSMIFIHSCTCSIDKIHAYFKRMLNAHFYLCTCSCYVWLYYDVPLLITSTSAPFPLFCFFQSSKSSFAQRKRQRRLAKQRSVAAAEKAAVYATAASSGIINSLPSTVVANNEMKAPKPTTPGREQQQRNVVYMYAVCPHVYNCIACFESCMMFTISSAYSNLIYLCIYMLISRYQIRQYRDCSPLCGSLDISIQLKSLHWCTSTSWL